MVLVKRDGQGNVIESYEIYALAIDFDKKTINASITSYKIKETGVPVAEDSAFVLFDGKDYETSIVSRKLSLVKRDDKGAIIFDDKGNPITELVSTDVQESKEVIVSSFSEVMNVSINGTMQNSIRKSILEAFQKYKLKDSSFKIED